MRMGFANLFLNKIACTLHTSHSTSKMLCFQILVRRFVVLGFTHNFINPCTTNGLALSERKGTIWMLVLHLTECMTCMNTSACCLANEKILNEWCAQFNVLVYPWNHYWRIPICRIINKWFSFFWRKHNFL